MNAKACIMQYYDIYITSSFILRYTTLILYIILQHNGNNKGFKSNHVLLQIVSTNLYTIVYIIQYTQNHYRISTVQCSFEFRQPINAF